jgi:membrane protein YdbS with pleckstrin-like domain
VYSLTVTEPPVFERPDRRVLWVWRVSSLITYSLITLLLLVVAGVAVWRGGAAYWLLLGLIPVGLWGITAIVLRKQFEAWQFAVTDETLEIRHGWLWRQRRVVLRNRIQHIDLNSGPLDRRMDLMQVVTYTAGTTVGMIPGLRTDRALQLRRELVPALAESLSVPSTPNEGGS